MSNRLINQSSPYLLQHSENPVDWHPWCVEAFELARREDKPIFLSIGYSTCHWCHVMAHESFEKQEIADILNRYFVSVKVDREERPDIDSVYMEVCQAFTGRGGWPMSIFMTAEQKPFFAGTYFPPESNRGMIGFQDLLLTVADKWENNRDALLTTADDVSRQLCREESTVDSSIDEKLPEMAAEVFAQSFDKKYGGFGPAPKFPMPHNLIFLTLYSKIYQDKRALSQVEGTLSGMRRGGLFDQIGYGFSRYSTDKYYLVPHFEKMLYDNALLIMAYLAAYKRNHEKSYLETAEKTAGYIFREMTNSDGGFYSAQDADSDGEEGKYYLWGYGEICAVLGEEKGKKFCNYFDITEQGNFEGKNIPNLLNGNDFTEDFAAEIQALYQYRKNREKLHLDDKILTAWNSLMICAMSMLYRITGKQCYLAAARHAREYIEKNLADGNILYVSCREKVRSVKGFLDEYAYYTAALLSLYEVTSRNRYLERAQQICNEAERQFADKNGNGYFLCGRENGSLIAKPKETYDGALPSGNSVMAYCLVRLSQITERNHYKQMAERQLAFLSGEAEHYPAGYSLFLTALLLYLHPASKITVVLAEGDNREKIICRLPLYSEIKILDKETDEYKLLNGKTTYYVCENYTCRPPVNSLEEMGDF